MANNVKISLLGFPSLTGVYDPEANVQSMINYFNYNLNKVLPNNPDIILMPEASDRFAGFSIEQTSEYYLVRGEKILNFLCETAKKNHCNIAYSAIRNIWEDKKFPFRNSTQIIGRDGNIVGIYDKNHVVIPECDDCDIAYGKEAKVIESDIGKLACAICFDLNFNCLYERYKPQNPDLIVFCSQYHGGLKQQQWAFELRSYFASAISGDQSRILNPYGETVAASTNYYDYTTAKVNLDYTMAHIDFNNGKFIELKKKYGEGVTIYDPGYVGSVLITCEHDDMTVMDMIKEFDIELFDDYMERSLKHRETNLC
ncbi:MAG: carbon-nitrogen hydrolase family protein [Oscillospiraceae bacterium]|nr:carbon-nitrogen hydrolase family protein [Oscillospiraceae bacterium]